MQHRFIASLKQQAKRKRQRAGGGYSAPTVISVSPDHTVPGGTITITGTNLDVPLVVSSLFGILLGSVVQVDSHTLTGVVAVDTVPGIYDVTVTTLGGSDTLVDSLTVGAGAAVEQFIDLSNNDGSWVESPAHTWTVSAVSNSVGDLTLAGEGYVQHEITSTSDGVVMGLDSGSAKEDFTTVDFGVYVVSTVVYASFRTNAGDSTGATAAAGDLLRTIRTDATLSIEQSTNGGSSWSSIYTFADSSSVTLYPKWCVALPGAKVIKNPIGFGMT